MTKSSRELLDTGGELKRYVYSRLSETGKVFEKTFLTEDQAIEAMEKALERRTGGRHDVYEETVSRTVLDGATVRSFRAG